MKQFVLASLTAIMLAGLSNPALAGIYNRTLSGLDTGSGILIAAAADNGGYDLVPDLPPLAQQGEQIGAEAGAA